MRIAEGEHPQDIKESDYFTERGEFRVDSEGSPTLLNCLMYKLSYYRFMIKANQKGWLAIAKLIPLSLLISLLLMPSEAFDNVKIEK